MTNRASYFIYYEVNDSSFYAILFEVNILSAGVCHTF